MLKTPQDYWKDVEARMGDTHEDLNGLLRVAFFYGIVATLNFIEELATVDDKAAAFKEFSDGVDRQRIVETERRKQPN